jgi:hypothetical protein
MGWIDLSMACYEDGGAMTLCDVGRLTRTDFLTRWDGRPVYGVLRRWRGYEDGGAMPVCDIGRLTRSDFLTRWDGLTCLWRVTKMAGLCPYVM